jgi:hypothetical protein
LAALRRVGFGSPYDAVHVRGVTVLTANMLHKADVHEMATFFLRHHHVIASDRIRHGRFHFVAAICDIGRSSVTTGYVVNAAVTGHEPGCPPTRWAQVRWRISRDGVQHLDPVPRSDGCWPPTQHS